MQKCTLKNTLLLLVVFILFASVSAAFCSSFDCINKEKDHILTLILILFSGMLGGLLYSIQDEKKIMLPVIRKETNIIIELGIIHDVLFGISGGLLIFLLVPEFPSTGNSWGMIKLISLAIAGGYSGRVLTQKVADKNVEKLAKEVKEASKEINDIKQTDEADQEAHRIFSLILDEEFIESDAIRAAIENVSQMTVINGFELLNERRKRLAYSLIETESAKGPHSKIELIKKKFEPLIPLLEAIIDKEEKIFRECGNRKNRLSFLHLHYSSLAYLYKDKIHPKWDITLKHISKAIFLYEEAYIDKGSHYIYLFNRLLCYINLRRDEEARSEFVDLWGNNRGKYEIAISEPILAPGLREWIKNSPYCEEVKKYIADNYPDRKDRWDI